MHVQRRTDVSAAYGMSAWARQGLMASATSASSSSAMASTAEPTLSGALIWSDVRVRLQHDVELGEKNPPGIDGHVADHDLHRSGLVQVQHTVEQLVGAAVAHGWAVNL